MIVEQLLLKCGLGNVKMQCNKDSALVTPGKATLNGRLEDFGAKGNLSIGALNEQLQKEWDLHFKQMLSSVPLEY